MALAVTHVLIPIIVVDLIRDYIFKKKKRYLPLRYILIAGIAGLVADVDIIIFGVVGTYSYITHSLVLPLIFALLTLIAYKKIEKRSYYKIFGMIAVGLSFHILLDILVHTALEGSPLLFYPLSNYSIGFGIMAASIYGYTPLAALDGLILILWLIHEQMTHKIRDFI